MSQFLQKKRSIVLKGRYRYGDKFDEKEMSIFNREFSPAKQSVAEFKFTLNEFECIAREIKESEEKDKREILEEELKTETERHSADTTETYSEISRTNSDEIDTEAAEMIDLRASVDQDSTCTISPGILTTAPTQTNFPQCNP